MENNTTSKSPPGVTPSPSIGSQLGLRNRRDSINSISANSTVEKEQIANALDKIHTSASQSDTLTTFNDFARPPSAPPPSEAKASTGELVHHGLTGLYTRFREAVGVASPTKPTHKEEEPANDTASKRTSTAGSHVSKLSVSSLTRNDTVIPASGSTAQLSTATEPPSSTPSVSGESRGLQQPPSSRASGPVASSKPASSSRPSLASKPTASSLADPTIAPVTAHRDASRSTIRTEESGDHDSSRKSFGRSDTHPQLPTLETTSIYDPVEGKLPPISRDDASSYDGSVDIPVSSTKGEPPSRSLQGKHVRTPSAGSSMLSPENARRKPAVIDRISRSRSTIYSASRDSSMDRNGGGEASPVDTSAPNSAYNEPSAGASRYQRGLSGDARVPGSATTHEGASDHMSAQLDRMRRQVLSKEFWMKDDTVKECFLCQTPFTAFRRKHHCRTCGCIFDSKCTTVVSGEKFGVQGNLRVCKRCLDAINRRFEGSGSDESGDEQSFMPRIFGANQSKSGSNPRPSTARESDLNVNASEGSENARPVAAPMMAIPATRWVKESNRHSAVLEIDAPQLSRPGSSRSLKSLASARPQSSAGHKRHHSKHGFLGRFKAAPENRAPFRKGADDESSKKSKFPAFHDDNIIDPELADFMSDDSSGDEQVSIFATMSTSDLQSAGFEHEKTNLSPFMNAGRKHRHRPGEKSISGLSFLSRGAGDETSGPPSLLNHRRGNRRRNMSNVSGSVHHLGSPRPKSAIYKGPPGGSSEMLVPAESSDQSGTKLTRSDSLQKKRVSNTELNKSSLRHVDKLLHQLLQDSDIPDPEAWQKALVPILLQCTDDVSPDVFNGEDMDIRHYVKLKRIPGGKPGDTSYVSGVVFTKNLALKSMPRRIANPRIVLVTFPIEYQRHQQHFMSLQPVIEQEKEFLRVVVQRITNLRPHLLLVEKSVSGVALQYLSEANISVAYNVKHTVIEAVSRCAETEIITSLDRLAMPVRVGRCAGFEVKTYVNNNFVRRKKSYIFLSGCRPDLGCTIALRGATSELLAKVKYIMEFMVYVVYNLKLESSLLRDESIEPPDEGESSMSSSCHIMNDSFRSLSSVNMTDAKRQGPPVYVQQPSSESEPPTQNTVEGPLTAEQTSEEQTKNQDRPNLISMHEAHEEASPESQVPDDVPMPTFYSDMVAKYETKILSASPYVKFTQPYLLMKAREQERRLLYLRRLRDQDIIEEKGDSDKPGPPKFQLIKPDMVEEIGQKAPRQIMDILHAVHDAEYDKALFNYQTQTRQWETYIQGNLDLFDPYSHQNIVVLYSEICTETKIPCTEPSLVAINFYDEQHVYTGMDPDCTLGQYIQDLAEAKDRVCESSGCERKLIEHHRTYVHDQSRITVFVENAPPGTIRHLNSDSGITMWTYCKICKKDSDEVSMSEATYKYSFGKYLELLYWGRGLRMKHNIDCSHDHHRDHVRYFSLNDARIRIHWDPIDLLEIVVPRARITWKVVNDLKLKNEIYTKLEERWRKFMSSVKVRLDGIRIDSVLPEKADACKAEVELLTKKAQDELPAMIRNLEDIYVKSKYYEVVPFNSLVRDMLELAGEWDQAFAKFEADYLGDKDMRQLTMMQLKKMFTDNESKESLASTEGTSAADSDDRPSQTFSEVDEKSTQPTDYTENSLDGSASYAKAAASAKETTADENEKVEIPAEGAIERVEPLNLEGAVAAISTTPSGTSQQTSEAPSQASAASSLPRPQASPISGNGRSPTDPLTAGPSLTEKVDQMRREQAKQASQSAETDISANSTDMEQTPSRVSGTSTSPPMVRAISHPARTLPRSQAGAGKTLAGKDTKVVPAEAATETPSDGTIKVDKRFSDRIGINALKQRGKGATSSIPRLVQKKKESKVSTLARHFEQLSREFEKERIRDRKKRAASLRQPRVMLPRTSTKAIVQVYDDVNEAFEEPALPNDAARPGQKTDANAAAGPNVPKSEQSTEPPTPIDAVPRTVDQQLGTDNEESTTVPASQTGTDDEGEGSDTEPSVSDEFLPDIKEIADATKEIPLELPKHQKTSLMKYLTNFWAERSASGWPPLEYPVNPTDHIFVDSDVIVREDEPSSVIALALNSDDYQTKLEHIRREAQEGMQREVESNGEAEPKSTPASDGGEFSVDESDLEKSLLRVTGTHLKYQFKEGAAVMTCKIFYAEQFDALRRKCGVAERIVESLSRCLKWDSKGGKTKSVFLKTLDDRLVLKVSSMTAW